MPLFTSWALHKSGEGNEILQPFRLQLPDSDAWTGGGKDGSKIDEAPFAGLFCPNPMILI